MLKRCRSLGIALILACVALVGLGVAVLAQEGLSPPYVIVLSPWSVNARLAAVDPCLGYAYVVANRGIAVFQSVTRTSTIDIGTPNNIAVDTTRGYVYVTSTDNYVSVLTATATITPRLLPTRVDVGAPSYAAAVLTTTGDAYVVLPGLDDPGPDQVAVLHGVQKVASITVGDLPTSIAVNPSTDYVYVANQRSHTVSVIHRRDKLPDPLPGHYMTPTQVTVNPATNYVYVCNSDYTLTILHGLEFRQTITFTTGDPVDVAVNSTTGLVYVAVNNRSIANPRGWIEVFEGETRLGISVPVAADVRALALNPKSGYVYVSHGSGEATVVTIMSGTLALESFPMGQTAPNIAVDPVQDLAYVPIFDGRVAIFGRTPVYASPLLSATMTEDVSFGCLNVQMGQALPVTITISPDAVTAPQMRVLCTPLRDVESPGLVWGKQAFRLFVSYEPTGTVPLVYEFDPPLLITATYVSALPGGIVENELQLWRGVWSGPLNRWVWDSSSAHLVQRSLAKNWWAGHVDRTGHYALMWQARLYLPFVMRQS